MVDVADEVFVSLEEAEGAEGAVTIDITSVPDEQRESVRDRLVRMFSPVILRVADAQGDLLPYGVEVVQCKVCASLHQKKAGPLLAHARYHEKEKRIAHRAPRRRR